MYLIITRSFPPEIGGMQNLMWGLTKELSKHCMLKVFADHHNNHKDFDEKVSFSIERVGGIKLLRKYRKAQLINEFIRENKIETIIADHWKSLELIKTNKKKICLIHSKEINHGKDTNLNKRAVDVLNNVETVVANSKFTKELAVSHGVDESKIVVINLGFLCFNKFSTLNTDSLFNSLTGSIPGLIIVILFFSAPKLTAKSFVNFEFATMLSTLFKTLRTLLFKFVPLVWLISLE